MSTNKYLKGLNSHYTEIAGKKMHYLDEGSGPVILFVHGIPEWCATYAETVKLLSKEFRCVVPDHIGFGLSEKDMDIDLSPAAHSKRLLEFIQRLQLKDIHLVVHDYGGPIGLGALVQSPELFNSVSICNTWLWSLKGGATEKSLRMMQGALGKWLYLNYGFSVKFMAKNGFADKKLYREEAKEMLLSVHRTKEERYGNYRLMIEMLNSSAHFDRCFEWLKQLQLKGQFIWGMKDKFFSAEAYLQKWKEEFPGLAVHEIAESGHFPQMEATAVFSDHLKTFIKEEGLKPA